MTHPSLPHSWTIKPGSTGRWDEADAHAAAARALLGVLEDLSMVDMSQDADRRFFTAWLAHRAAYSLSQPDVATRIVERKPA